MFPIFVENSKVPVIASYFNAIDTWAISLGIFVFCRGEMSEVTRQHETIHYHQWRELGFILFPILYGFYFYLNRFRGMDGVEAYYAIPFEKEAYAHQSTEGYLETRPFWAWLNYRS